MESSILVILLVLWVSMLKQFSQALNSDGIIVRIVILVYVLRMQCQFMMLNETHYVTQPPDDSKAEIITA